MNKKLWECYTVFNYAQQVNTIAKSTERRVL